MIKTTMQALWVSTLIVVCSGCGSTTVVTPTERTTEVKVKVSDDGSKKTTKETVVRDNPDGTTTTLERKTETKVKTDDDVLIKLPGIEIKKN